MMLPTPLFITFTTLWLSNRNNIITHLLSTLWGSGNVLDTGPASHGISKWTYEVGFAI